jgi:hypothetical protein
VVIFTFVNIFRGAHVRKSVTLLTALLVSLSSSAYQAEASRKFNYDFARGRTKRSGRINKFVLCMLSLLIVLLSVPGITFATSNDYHFVSVVGDTFDGNLNNDGASGTGTIAIGANASSVNDSFLPGSIAVGYNSSADGAVNTAIGAFSKVSGFRNTALGYASWVNIETSTADFIPAGGGVAIGDQSYVSAANSVALGALSNAQITRTGDVALFSGEKIAESGVVSLGHRAGDVDNSFPGSSMPTEVFTSDVRRQIINVAGGVDDYDAVNIAQLKAVDNKISSIQTGLENLSNKTDGQVKGIAALNAALSGLKPIQYDPVEPTQIMVALGSYKDKQGVALGLAHYVKEDLMVHAGLAFGSGEGCLLNVGLTYKFGGKNNGAIQDKYKAGPISSVYVMQTEIEKLQIQNRELSSKIDFLLNRLAGK